MGEESVKDLSDVACPGAAKDDLAVNVAITRIPHHFHEEGSLLEPHRVATQFRKD